MELTGRTIVVTGGASGIGKAMAERFAMEAAQGVVVADIDEAGAVAAAAEVPGAAIGVGCDVTDEAQVNALIDRAEEEFGTVDIFCANAGIGLGSRLDASDEEWKQVMDVNVMAHVYAARRLVPAWLERGEGYFVSTASAAGMLSQIGDVTYSVSKHGAVAFAEWLAITYGDRGLRVSCLCPMGVNTPLVQRGLEMEDERGLGAKIVAASGDLLDPADVAKDVMAALKEERFFILPHPVVGEYYRRKGDDHDRWLNGMRRLQARVEEAVQAGLMPKLVVLHHLDKTLLGGAAVPIRESGLEVEERDLKRGDPLPAPGEADAILSLGGDQSVRDLAQYDYLQAEVDYLRDEAERGTPILGVCLGGQLLAHALGGTVDRLPQRIVDWVAVQKLPDAEGDPVIGPLPNPVRTLHWNEDGFTIPPGAVELLERAAGGGEAFRWGDSAWGIQFHPEADEEILDGWYHDVDWLAEAGVEQAAAREADRVHLPGQRATAEGIFGGFARYVIATRTAPARPR